MARGTLPLTQITRDGVAAAAEVNGDATNGHQVTNDELVILLVRNSNGASTARTITFETPGTVDSQAVADRTKSIPAGTSQYFGPFPVNVYGSTLLIDVDNAELKLSAYHFA
jgi:hypothetical protein